MRLDKYLWFVRIFKTRSQATKACMASRLLVNDIVVKASKDVALNDIVSIRQNPVWRTYKITGMPKSRVGPHLVAEFVIETTPFEDLETLKRINLENKANRSISGYKGRPTKKIRRENDRNRQ